jgi:hypothetical protein
MVKILPAIRLAAKANVSHLPLIVLFCSDHKVSKLTEATWKGRKAAAKSRPVTIHPESLEVVSVLIVLSPSKLLDHFPCRPLMIKAAEARAITKVASHPTICTYREGENCPTTEGLRDINMRMNINGTETTPLITADQYRARIGFNPKKVRQRPMTVAAAITA